MRPLPWGGVAGAFLLPWVRIALTVGTVGAIDSPAQCYGSQGGPGTDATEGRTMGHPGPYGHDHADGGHDLGLGLLVGTACALILAGGLHIAGKREEARRNGADCPFGFARLAPGAVIRCISEETADYIAEDCYQHDHGHDGPIAVECGETPAAHARHEPGACSLDATDRRAGVK